MLVYNKYLKELGIDSKDFPFSVKAKDDPRYGLDKRDGVVEAQTFSLDWTIVCELYTYFRYFQDHCMVNYPAHMTPDEWAEIVQKIIDGLKSYCLWENQLSLPDKEREKLKKSFDEAWQLLGEHFTEFWW